MRLAGMAQMLHECQTAYVDGEEHVLIILVGVPNWRQICSAICGVDLRAPVIARIPPCRVGDENTLGGKFRK